MSMLVVYAPLKMHDAEAVFSSTVGKKEHPETIQRKVKCAYVFSENYVCHIQRPLKWQKNGIVSQLISYYKKNFPKPFTE